MRPDDRTTPRARWTSLSITALAATGAIACGASAVLAGPTTAPAVVAAATTSPTTQPIAMKDPLQEDLQRSASALFALATPKAMADPASRTADAPTVIPLIKHAQAAFHAYGAAHHAEPMYAGIQQQLESELYLYGDKETVDRVDAAAGATASADSIVARAVQLHARWIGAGHDAAAQQPIAEELVKLDGAHPESNALTALTYTFSNTAASAELKASLLGVVTTQMTTPMAQRIAASIKQKAEADAKLAALVNKPLVLAGTTVDGQPFSIGQYKGKVVLVDFWATWCGPCKAELPHVKDVYAKYHDKGLEIVGVSNDFKADELRKFTPENGMPWVELFDAQAAADHQWNPLTENFGILGIPTMFLVDKKGIMRTYEAREDMDTLIPKLLSE